jgi:tRNA threonylcarbamoyl adenosine modification protein (Sua5/YciO/YrdC/YwlC family)
VDKKIAPYFVSMAAEFIRIHPDNPEGKKIDRVAEILKKGGLVIYPTDTVYGLGCDIFNTKAIEKVLRLKGVKHMNLSFICYDLSDIAHYAKVSTPTFKLMKKALPGPFTFILPSSSKVPKMLNTRKKTVGIRVPDHHVPRMLVKSLGNPIITTSILDEDEIIEYSTDPGLIYEKYEQLVDVVIDGDYGGNEPSTVVNCTTDDHVVIRQGKGELDELN